jgi:anthranilate phosphoribosyltransferase
MFPQIIAPLLDRHDLSPEAAEELMAYLTSGQASDAEIGGALIGLRVKGVSVEELTAFVRVVRRQARILPHDYDDLVDTCGTGGGASSFNLSTAAAFVAAGAGARIAKHGNRAVTSKCGMSDVLEALDVPMSENLDELKVTLDRFGLVFMYAPAHHPTMANVGPARRRLGVRTVFNQIGPLANPAGARRQLIGVYGTELLEPMARALVQLGVDRALIVHADDGLDEISPVSETSALEVRFGELVAHKLSPEMFGQTPIDPVHLHPGADVADSAEILVEAISDAASPRSAALIPNAAAAIWLAGVAPDLLTGAELARASVASGNAFRKLAELQNQRADR